VDAEEFASVRALPRQPRNDPLTGCDQLIDPVVPVREYSPGPLDVPRERVATLDRHPPRATEA
jgi:hypothetical protein